MRGCLEMRYGADGETYVGSRGIAEGMIWDLVDYKLKSNYLSLPAYIRKGNGDVR